MADTTFPVLSRGAHTDIKEVVASDPTLRSEMENGRVLTRARFTGLKRKWSYSIRDMLEADKTSLTSMQTTVRVGSGTIEWTHPKTAAVIDVRLAEPITFELDEFDHLKWSAKLILVEA